MVTNVKNEVNKKEKSLLGKARAAIKQLSFTKTSKDKIEINELSEAPKSATLKKESSAMKLAGKQPNRRASGLPESMSKLPTQWEMYAITEEDPHMVQ